MALTPEEQQRKLNSLIREGIQLARQLNDTQQEASFQNFTGSLTDAERLVGSLRDEWAEYTRDVAGTALNFQRIVDEIKAMNSGTKISQQAFSGLNSLAQRLQSHQEGISKLSSKEIKNLKDKVKNKVNELKLAKDLLSDQLSQSNLSDAERAKAQAAYDNIENSLYNTTSALHQLNTQLKVAAEEAETLEDALGLGGNALKGMQETMSKLGLGGLADKLGLDEANEAMEEMAAKLTNNGEKVATLGDKFKILGAGMKSAFSNLSKNLLDPKVLITEFVATLQQADEATGKLAKDFNLTYSEALSTRRELSNMAALSGDVAVNTKGLQESMVAVGQSLGTNAQLNQKDLITFTKLREQAGFTNDELVGIQKLSLVNNKTLEENTKEILGGAEAYATRNGFVVNEKDVLREVSKASASLKLTLGGSAEAVAVAAVKAKQFGLNLEQAEKISESLLQFESSIENELSAELLTGKNLNLERARSLALEGKTADAAAEIAKQVGTSRDFAKMNVIQQEALAKAAGMTRDELAQSLMDREALTKLSAKEGETAQQAFDRRVKEVGLEQAKKELGDEALSNQFAQQSVQERFLQATEKLKEVFVSMAEPVLAILSPLSDIVSSVLPLINVLLQPILFTFQTIGSVVSSIFTWLSESEGLILGLTSAAVGLGVAMNYNALKAGAMVAYEETLLLLKGEGLLMEKGKAAIQAVQLGYQAAMGSMEAKRALIEKGGFMRSIGEAIMKVISSLASIPVVGWALGLAAAGTVAALGYKYMNDGVISPSSGGSGYGDRVLYGPEGAISFNNKDTIVAGTDLFKKGDDVVSAPKSAITVANSTAPKPAPVDSNTLLASQMKRSNDLKEQEMRRDRTVSTLRIQ